MKVFVVTISTLIAFSALANWECVGIKTERDAASGAGAKHEEFKLNGTGGDFTAAVDGLFFRGATKAGLGSSDESTPRGLLLFVNNMNSLDSSGTEGRSFAVLNFQRFENQLNKSYGVMCIERSIHPDDSTLEGKAFQNFIDQL
jgi:hypothetical protein